MLADREGSVRVRAAFAGEVEICVQLGQRIHAGGRLAVVEGDSQLATLRARKASTISELLVQDGEEVEENALLMVLDENG